MSELVVPRLGTSGTASYAVGILSYVLSWGGVVQVRVAPLSLTWEPPTRRGPPFLGASCRLFMAHYWRSQNVSMLAYPKVY